MPQEHLDKNLDGFATLVAVVALLVVAALISTAALVIGAQDIAVSTVAINSASASQLADTCANMALVNLINDTNYTGPETINVGTEFCEIIAVLGTGDTDRTINTEATIGSSTRRVQVSVQSLSPSPNINYWGEVENF